MDECWFTLVKGEGVSKLFVLAKNDVTLAANSLLLGHGAGSWLQDDKGVKHVADYPGKSFACNITTDTIPVVLEQSSGDSELMTLRACIRKLETQGHTNFVLTNHTFERPAEVIAGTQDDQFRVVCALENGLVWKANAVNKDYKMLNVASVFQESELTASPAVRCVWRMRFYKNEGMVAPAKPLWFLKQDLQMVKDQAIRLL